MRLTKVFFIWISLCAVLAACTDEVFTRQQPLVPSETDGYYFIIDKNSLLETRAVNYESDNRSVFSEGDVVGVFALQSGGLEVKGASNVAYKVKNISASKQALVPADESAGALLPQGEGYTYVFYYPYQEYISLDNIRSFAWSVQADQSPGSNEDENQNSRYEQSDLLWDVASQDEEGKVNVSMNHAMANIILKIDKKLLQGGSSVVMPDMRVKITEANLTEDYTDSWHYTVPVNSCDTGYEDPQDITMWKYAESSDGVLTFRAVVPACRTIPKNQTEEWGTHSYLFKITDAEGNEKQYGLKEDLALKPGHNYIFQVKSEDDVPIPVPGDDDSWVLDVYDKNHNLVGLLCREYLRYQPTDAKDEYTGTAYGDSKCINSQAWVLYNLKEDGKTPNLDEGQVMRFIYDMDIRANGVTATTTGPWPAPHWQKMQQGLFTPAHGKKWDTWYASDGYGHEADREEQYYMHGGTIIWDGESNKISDFILPTEQITNATAKFYGHITYNEETDRAEVSYEMDDPDECSVTPHNLIDQRGGETIAYPLVKIGYNQFWMSKSLSATKMTDGIELICYNNPNGGISFTDDQTELEAGYIYPYYKNGEIDYDPYRDDQLETPYDGSTYTPIPLYNKTAIDNPDFLPASQESITEYIMPSEKELGEIIGYFGPLFAGKFTARYVSRYSENSFAESLIASMQKGETRGVGGTQANVYTANISGFNLRALGALDPNDLSICASVTDDGILMVRTDENEADYVRCFRVHNYDPFTSTTLEQMIEKNRYPGAETRITKYFAQVRFVMKFLNQKDNSDAASVSTRSVPVSRSRQGSPDTYITLE